MSSDSPDVIVVGGGIIGAACARALSIAGIQTLVIDAGDREGAATPASAGMLAPVAEAHREDPLLALCVRGRDLYGELVPELEEETSIDVHHWAGGILQIAFTEEEAAEAKNQVAWQRQAGLHSDWLPAEDVKNRFPGIADDLLGGVLAAEDGAVEPMALHQALMKSAELHGARLVQGQTVTAVLTESGRAAGVKTNEGSTQGGAVLIAAGCWSGQIEGLPRPLSVEPVKGQMAALERLPEGSPSIVYGAHGYVVNVGPQALIGATMEHAGFDCSVTDEGFAQVLQSACRIYPALRDRRVLRKWAGLRPGTPDGNPIIGRDAEVQNLWYATGHGRNGILLAGLSGRIVASLYSGDEIEYDLAPVDPARFWTC